MKLFSKTTRKKITALVLAAGVMVMGFAGCGKKEEKKEGGVDVVIGTANGSLCLAPLHVAIDNGYFEEEFSKEGITWKTEEIDMGNIGDLVASNKIDASTQLAGSMIPQIDNGLEITFTAGMHTGCTKVYTKESSGITKLADLKNKKIGVPSLGDSSVIALKRALYDEGIGVTTENLEVEWVVYGLTDLPLALENGAVDAVALHDPVAYQAEQEYGFTKILDLSTDAKFAGEYCCMSFVTKRLAEKNPKAAAAYTRAILRACAFVEANPEEAAKLQIDNNQCSGDVETNASLLRSYNYSPSVNIASDTIHNAATELIRIGELKSDNPDEFVGKAFTKFDGVPDSYKYENGEFIEVK
ncbi:ABC transporter substrate-binding protein [Eubacterium ruminantium]|uniref:ABC transporter substrate-binding protein n=1 Tax=Eubacterium ruminantium TaxID=42322 RepID=UPI001568ADC9|nr:ABC transporter substrate-binding protein [Eubacterium ruminantium]